MFSVERQALGRENNIGDLGNGSPTPCKGCYSATLPSPLERNRDPGCYKRCYRAQHRVLHFSTRLEAATSHALDYSTENSEEPVWCSPAGLCRRSSGRLVFPWTPPGGVQAVNSEGHPEN